MSGDIDTDLSGKPTFLSGGCNDALELHNA